MKRSMVLLVVLTVAALARGEETWQTKKVLGYTLHFTVDDAAEMDAVANVLEEFDRSFVAATGAESKLFSAIRIGIYLHPASSKEVTVGYISLQGGPNARGDVLGYDGTIKMPGPRAYDGKNSSSSGHAMDRNAFDKFLVHEVAPAYLELYARSRGTRFHDHVPDWFQDGLEEYFAVFHSTSYWRTKGIKTYHRRLQNDPAAVDTDFGLNVRDRYNDGLI